MEDIVDIGLRRDTLFCINSDDDGLVAELLSIVEENASTKATLQMMHDNARKVLMILLYLSRESKMKAAAMET